MAGLKVVDDYIGGGVVDFDPVGMAVEEILARAVDGKGDIASGGMPGGIGQRAGDRIALRVQPDSLDGAVEPLPARYKEVRYDLCRIAFDPADSSFGPVVDTLCNASSRGKSVSFPRVSPNGRFLALALHDHGTFSIWHKDADLYMLDLRTGDLSPLAEANSDDVESYHSWSDNSRWMVFSSRRTDGLYTRPFITYIDSCGRAYKPFLLPQKDPLVYYMRLMYSYNIPELTSGKVEIDKHEIVRLLRNCTPKRLK